MNIYLANKDSYGTNDILGKCEISLQPLRDQMKHEQWFDFERTSDPNQFGRSTRISSLQESVPCGSVHLTLQWVFCKEKYFEQGLKRLEETLREETLQRNQVQTHLDNYQMPFKKLLNSEVMIELDPEVEIERAMQKAS